MKNNTIVAFVDGSKYSEVVCQYTAWLAEHKNSKIKIYHILEKNLAPVRQDLSGAINLGARTKLLEDLSESDAIGAKTKHSEGWKILEKAKETLNSNGKFIIETRLRSGDLAEALSKKEQGADVIVIGKRGERKQDSGSKLGLNFERIVRASKKPIFVANRKFQKIEKVLVAFDGSPPTKRIVDFISRYDFFSAAEVILTYAGRSMELIKEPFSKAAIQLQDAGISVNTLELKGDPKQELAKLIPEEGFDLLAMGAYGHSKVRSFILGSTTTQLIQTVKVPVVLTR